LAVASVENKKVKKPKKYMEKKILRRGFPKARGTNGKR
jgi:hypothetical protein